MLIYVVEGWFICLDGISHNIVIIPSVLRVLYTYIYIYSSVLSLILFPGLMVGCNRGCQTSNWYQLIIRVLCSTWTPLHMYCFILCKMLGSDQYRPVLISILSCGGWGGASSKYLFCHAVQSCNTNFALSITWVIILELFCNTGYTFATYCFTTFFSFFIISFYFFIYFCKCCKW